MHCILTYIQNDQRINPYLDLEGVAYSFRPLSTDLEGDSLSGTEMKKRHQKKFRKTMETSTIY